jgi:hypothetical protein
LRRKWQSLPKLVGIIGGFLTLMGIILLGIAALALFGYLNVDLLLERKYLLTFAIAMIVVGLLDTFSAVIIARW